MELSNPSSVVLASQLSNNKTFSYMFDITIMINNRGILKRCYTELYFYQLIYYLFIIN